MIQNEKAASTFMNAHDSNLHEDEKGATQSNRAGAVDVAHSKALPNEASASQTQEQNEAKKFQAAYEYSKRVRRLKIGLPFIGALCIVVFIGLAIVGQWIQSPIGNATIDLTSGQVVMDNPSLSGFTASDASYEIVADRALQDLDDPKKVLLEKIGATLTLEDGNIVSVDANAGRFDVDTEQLILNAGVSIHMSSGYDAELREVHIDMKEGTLTSNNAVSIKADIGDIQANNLFVRDNGAIILFEDRVKLTINPNEIRTQ